ncbi:MAG: hypothetical protein GY839_21265 [candidate division Zixibacteria bacterium]|nr:hypothetical protein [candidate division Zixibacteria bacterium]
MNNRKTLKVLVVILSVYISMPISLNAADNIPESSIDLVLDMDAELQLTDIQISGLLRVNKFIIGKMIPLRERVEISEKDICGFTSKWFADRASVDDAAIDDYYKCLAEIKSLELEAIVKARTILTKDQLETLDNRLVSSKSIALILDCIPECNY